MTTSLIRPSRGLRYDPALACQHLTQADPKLGQLIARVGPCTLRPRATQSLFAALTRSIVYQQLSGRAAATILGRVVDLFPDTPFPRPEDILACPPERLRAAGLSTAKTAAVRDLAARTLDGTVPPLAVVHRLTDDEIIERLTVVRGIGRWTVEMLLIFRLGRPDVLPVDDLGVRKGFGRIFTKRPLPAARTLTRWAERWRPYRSVGSWYMWRALEL